MNEEIYQQALKSSRQAKRKLLLRGIFLVLFWGAVLAQLGYVLPKFYYQHTGTDPELAQRIYTENQASTRGFSDDSLDLYRFYWFEMNYGNLHYDPSEGITNNAFLGKQETYYLTHHLGDEKIYAYEVDNRFVGPWNATQEIRLLKETRVLRQGQLQKDHLPVTIAELTAAIKELGSGATVDVSVTLKQPLSPVDARVLAEEITVTHFGLALAANGEFGYSPEMLFQITGNDYNQRVTIAVTQGLQHLSENYSRFGDLGLDGYATLASGELNTRPNNFDDIKSYLADNGMKVSELRLTGDGQSVGGWLDKHQDAIQRLELKDTVFTLQQISSD